jgi:large subunit ribosomal protein L24e
MTMCVFCGIEESPYKGVSVIKNDGSVNFFCSGKCRKNALNLKRDRKKIKWTEAYRITAEKAAVKEKAVQDAAEAKKNEQPVAKKK